MNGERRDPSGSFGAEQSWQPPYDPQAAPPWESAQQSFQPQQTWQGQAQGWMPPATPAHPPPPPTPDGKQRVWSRKKSFALFVTLLLGLVVVVAVFYIFIETTGLAAVEANVPSTASIGECYDDNGSKVPVPCDGSHRFEVFEIVVYDHGVGYPGNLSKTFGNELCDDQFEVYTGENYYLSELHYQEVFPSEQDWVEGDRWVPCAIYRENLGPIGKVFSP